MDTPETTQNATPNGPKRKVLFLLGIVFGLLLGAALMLLVVNWLDYRRPREVEILRAAAPEGGKDTIVNLVIHRHVNPKNQIEIIDSSDSTSLDSLLEEDATQDLYMDETVALMDGDNDENDVYTPKMLENYTQKVMFLDNNKKEMPALENLPAHIQIQIWNTLVKNRIMYQFSGDVLKLKGVQSQNLKVVYWKNSHYLINGKHVYEISANNHFENLMETRDVVF